MSNKLSETLCQKIDPAVSMLCGYLNTSAEKAKNLTI